MILRGVSPATFGSERSAAAGFSQSNQAPHTTPREWPSAWQSASLKSCRNPAKQTVGLEVISNQATAGCAFGICGIGQLLNSCTLDSTASMSESGVEVPAVRPSVPAAASHSDRTSPGPCT